MATASDIKLYLFEGTRGMFRRSSTEELDRPQCLEAWARGLRHISLSDLKAAIEAIQDDPPWRDFPDLHEFKKFLRKVRPQAMPYDAPPRALREADVCAHPMAAQWAREGILGDVFTYGALHGRYPDDHALESFRKSWSPFLQTVAELLQGEHPIGKLMLDLAQTMLSRAAFLSRNAGVADSPAERALMRFAERRNALKSKPKMTSDEAKSLVEALGA
jgi:hypothetical protein